MVTIKTLLEGETTDKHINEEAEYFGIGLECLEGLIKYVNKEKKGAEDWRVKHYDKIKEQAEALHKTMKEHLEGYKDED